MMNVPMPMTNRPGLFAIRSSALFICLLLASCSSIPMPSFFRNPAAEAVVFALGPRDGFTSPLNGSLKPACPALMYDNADFHLTAAHQQAIHNLAQEMLKNKKARLLIAGYAPPNLPQDHARSISERRALAVSRPSVSAMTSPPPVRPRMWWSFTARTEAGTATVRDG
jgi:hypothetical protein